MVFLFLALLFLSNSTLLAAPTEPWKLFFPLKPLVEFWYKVPPVTTLPSDRLSEEIRYGRDLIVRTAYYLGPKGSVAPYLGNRMNCQNCHLDAGTRLFGGSFRSTHGKYPQYRERNDTIISLPDRINQCIQRPHHGKPLPYDSREMRAIILYIKWLGEKTRIGGTTFGDTLVELRDMSHPADPMRGKTVYAKHCTQCHGMDGFGQLESDGMTYVFPPLWGPDSYSIGSSMHRVRKAAGFIKVNMPFGADWKDPILSDEEALDVAAFINDDTLHKRPRVDVSKDYPHLEDKPLDYPYGPYLDSLSDSAHKFGPWHAMNKQRKNPS